MDNMSFLEIKCKETLKFCKDKIAQKELTVREVGENMFP